jgi:CubicO group peptidase (beta-lactamase class C family)
VEFGAQTVIEISKYSNPSLPGNTQHSLIHELLASQYGAALSIAPGEEMVYCNLNYAFLGEIVRRVSGQSHADFATERIFTPLGMSDTFCVVPDSMKSKVVRHPDNSSFANLNAEPIMDTPMSWTGVYSTSRDMAVFGQMFLNGGIYDGTRILSAQTVETMTRNQIPGVGTNIRGEPHKEALWGYGWNIFGGDNWKYQPGTLMSDRSFSHNGAGGLYLWVDPDQEIVGVYFSVATEFIDGLYLKSSMDLFVNAVTAAVED